MIKEYKLNDNGTQLYTQLLAARQSSENYELLKKSEPIINIAGVGRLISTAYEQLRNATEYAQEHLLMQKAMRRFYVRNLSFQNKMTVKKTIAEELIIELTQSGYIDNNTQPVKIISDLKTIIDKHYNNFWRLKAAKVDVHTAQKWILDLLSVEAENIIVKDNKQTIFVHFAYRHYKETLSKDLFISTKSDELIYESSLYIAAHRSLLKSDVAMVRYDMEKMYNISDKKIDDYIYFHKNIDKIFYLDITNKITRYINKYGAPLRILNSMIQNDDISEYLNSRENFNDMFGDRVERDYKRAKSKLNSGLIKSIIFLLITKSLIGLAIEIPYDLFATGTIVIMPLVINLLTPVVYMTLLRLGMKMPNNINTKAILSYTDEMLYSDGSQVNLRPVVKDKSYPTGFKIAYAVMFLTVFGLVFELLAMLGFNIVQGVIFFIFFATSSFLGFRLSRIVQELELVVEKSGILTTVRDYLFLPFTMLGKWLSEKYQKVNIVSLILDTIIELPLKTLLRLVRQWTGFIDQKKDEI